MKDIISKLTTMNANGSQFHPEYFKEIQKRSGRSAQAVQTAVFVLISILSFFSEDFSSSNKNLFDEEELFFICGYERLTKLLGFTEKQVREANHLLENIGLIMIDFRPIPGLGKTTHLSYHVNIDMLESILGYDIATEPTHNQALPSESPMVVPEVTHTLPEETTGDNKLYILPPKRDDDDARVPSTSSAEEYEVILHKIKSTALQSKFQNSVPQKINDFIDWLTLSIHPNGTIPIGGEYLCATESLEKISTLSVQNWNDICYRMTLKNPSRKGWNAYLLSSLYSECSAHDSIKETRPAPKYKPAQAVGYTAGSSCGYKQQAYDFVALQKFIDEN